MACIYTYKNKEYSRKEIEDLLFKEEVNPTDIKYATLGDIADLLAYSNSKLILPGNEVVYTTPDNQTFKTYQEASNHISELVRNIEDVDLENITLDIQKDIFPIQTVDEIPVSEFYSDMGVLIKKDGNKWIEYSEGGDWVLKDTQVVQEYNNVNELAKDYSDRKGLNSFLDKNKEYEQSAEIIEEWKKINNIKYDPEEVYSRGQGFYSVVGAYSDFDVELMFQNLLNHIQDNKRAGGEFTISAFTKPVDKQIGHLEGGGGKIKFKIFPKSEDIKWAANTDVNSGSVWDASEKVSKDKKSELIGVSYTKSPSLRSLDSVQPNLADIIDKLAHHHNELGIELTGNNFRLEYDNDVPYSTKKLINNINSILDQKYGKLVEPKISKTYKDSNKYAVEYYETGIRLGIFNTKEEAQAFVDSREYEDIDNVVITTISDKKNIKLKEDIFNTKNRLINERYDLDLKEYKEASSGKIPEYYNNYTDLNGKLSGRVLVFALNVGNTSNEVGMWQNEEYYDIVKDYIVGEEQNKHGVKFWILSDEFKKEALASYKKPIKEKEYTSQALTNLKVAALKKANKKYPRSLIRSEVIKSSFKEAYYGQEAEPEELFFQKVGKDVFGKINIKDNQNQVNKEQREQNDKVKKTLQDIIISTQNRYKALTLRSKNAGEELSKTETKQKELLDRLERIYEEGIYLKGIQEYLDAVRGDYELLYGKDENDNGSIGSLKKRIENVTYKDVLKESHLIRSMGNFAATHYKLTEDIIKSLEDSISEFTTSELKTQAKELIKQSEILKVSASKAKRDYADLSTILVSVFLNEFGWQGSVDRLRDVLSQPAVDISWSQKMLTSMANVNDDVLRLTAKAIVSFKEDARNENIELEKQLIEAKIKLEKAGIKDTYWMFNKDENGVPTGDYITERDWNTYERKREEFYNKFNSNFDISYGEYVSFDEATKLNFKRDLPENKQKLLDKFNQDIKVFRAEYTLTNQEAVKLINEKKAQLNADEFKIWEGLNVQLNPHTGKFIIPRKLDSKFNEIKDNPLKLEYYNLITGLKSKLESSFPEKMRHPRRAPQLRRDNIERIKVGDIKSVGENLKEHFKIMDDESERGFDYGVEDETGKVISFVPIYYTKRLSNLKDLSLDSVSTIMEFARMANEYKNMTSIMDILEINKDVLYNRKVFKKNNRNLIIKTISKIAGEQIERTKESPITGGKIYEMYEGIMEMLIYGKLKVEGKSILGVDVQKFLDTIGMLTAVRQLGLNLYSPVANVITGGAQLRNEAAAKEYFGEKDLLWADGVYGENLLGLLNDLGSRLPQNKLTLWNEYMDVMEDFSEKARNLRVEEKTKLVKLFRISHVFFATHMGDHYMQMKGNLATAKQFRFNTETNRFVKKKDFYKPLEAIKDEMRASIRKNTKDIDKASIKSIVKDIQSQYKSKIDAKKVELDTKWDKMTNFWDAHEVKNNRLSLKEEFQNEHSIEDRKKFILLAKSLNQSFHGVYNENDRALIQRTAIGRLVMMFRKFMKPNWDRRFQKAFYDQRKESEVEGYYTTAGKFIKGLYNDYKKGEFSLYRNWALLTDEEKANFRRVGMEGIHLVAALALAALLTGMADDDDEWMMYYMAYQANRMITEIGAFVPYTPLFATESLRLLQTPMAATQPVQEAINFLQFWDWGDVIERGKYKGMTKFHRGLVRTIPLGKNIQDWAYPEDKLVFYKFL